MTPSGSHGRRVMLLGGSSEIGGAIVRELQGREPRDVMLVGRDMQAIGAVAADLTQAGCPRVLTTELDAFDRARHAFALDNAFAELGGADIVVLTVGVLGERGALPSDIDAAGDLLEVNLVGAGSLLMHSARLLRDGDGGTIVVLSSVGAERARKANAVYGASKAGLDALAQGLGDALHGEGVRIVVLRPGFVRSKMTRGLKPAPFATTPADVARVLVAALDGRKDTVWAPRAIHWMALALRHLPRPIFRRINA